MSNLIICDISHNIKQLVKIIIIFICLSSFSFYNNYSYNLYYIRKQNRKNRIAIVLGTRPEAIKMIPIIKQLKKNKNFKCFTINTGQHKKMINQILKSLKMSKSIDIKLNIMKKNQTLGELTSKTISKLSKIYSSIQPDAVVVQGDTTTSFAAALSAFYQKIPVFHVEAGLRTHNLYSPFPEEFNRIGIDDISTLYFAATNMAANNLMKENKNPNRIFVTGNTIVDTLKLTLENTSPSKYIKSILNRAMTKCKSKYNCKIILLTCHRRENYFGPIINILKVVQKLLEKFDDIVIILPFHLNPNVIQSIKMGLPNIIYDDIINGKEILNQNYNIFKKEIFFFFFEGILGNSPQNFENFSKIK
jgi:UDP-N-acetylglucosamine 2-epimerase (non-hydrolysing)